jgi:uncharacterized protein YcbK (DUF882 family)
MRAFVARAAAPLVFAAIASAAALSYASTARADITHVVQRGHTLEAIAHRYRVSVKALLEANHLTDPKSLRPGQELVIPGVEPPRQKRDASHDASHKAAGAVGSRPGSRAESRPASAAMERGHEPHGRGETDAIHAIRLGEEFRIRVKDSHGHIPPSALKAFERMMRQGNAVHPVDPRLVARIGIVSNHFDGKTIEVVSGFRAYTATQYTPHSNHNYGKALDFRIRGVPNEELRDFCRTLRGAGCGYYPNSSFVHLDVRDTKAFWVDWSHPGEPPMYDKPDVAADESAGEVPDETPAEGATESVAGAHAYPALPLPGSPEPHSNIPNESTSE